MICWPLLKVFQRPSSSERNRKNEIFLLAVCHLKKLSCDCNSSIFNRNLQVTAASQWLQKFRKFKFYLILIWGNSLGPVWNANGKAEAIPLITDIISNTVLNLHCPSRTVVHENSISLKHLKHCHKSNRHLLTPLWLETYLHETS